MNDLVSPRLTPMRVTGSSARWALDFGIAGALLPISVAPVPWLLGLGSPLGVASVVLPAAVVASVIGAVSPLLLDKFRRGVPLWLLTVLASVTGSTAMTVAWWLAGAHSSILLLLLMAGGGAAGATLWLPYTIAAVTRRPTFPIVMASTITTPLLAFVALRLWLMFG